MPKLLTKQVEFQIKESNEDKYTIRAVISSGQPDRQGDIIDQSSWNLDEYRKNPVVLWAHDHSQPAIGKAIDIFINADNMLEAVIKFAADEYQFAKTIYKLYAGGFMNAFSVGFTSKTQDVVNGINILKDNVLYEFSAVNVGADALALAKSKGIDVSVFEKKRKSPACRMEDESKQECVSRKIPEIMHENPDMKNDQAIAIAESLCSKACDEKSFVEKEGRVLSAKNRSIIENARDTLNKVLEADKEKTLSHTVKYNYRRILNKAVRELIKAKNE